MIVIGDVHGKIGQYDNRRKIAHVRVLTVGGIATKIKLKI